MLQFESSRLSVSNITDIMKPKANLEKRAIINAYAQDGLSVRTIATKQKIPRSTVHDTTKHYKETYFNSNKLRSRRP